MTDDLTTKERIVDKAGDIFGKKGFRAATIRMIARAAHANVAAINYHFRDKEGLYRAVLEDIFSKGFEKFPSIQVTGDNTDPKEKLRIFIHSMFYRFLSNEGWNGVSGPGKLIAREFLDPTPAFEDIVETYIKPQKDLLVSIIMDLSGNRPEIMDRIIPCALSIIGQGIYYAFAAPVIQRIAPQFMPIQENIDLLADHVFRFSLGGIQQINTDLAGLPADSPKETHE